MDKIVGLERLWILKYQREQVGLSELLSERPEKKIFGVVLVPDYLENEGGTRARFAKKWVGTRTRLSRKWSDTCT